jgi:LemA protein
MFMTFLAVVAAGLLILIYNRLVALRQTRKNAFSDIDVQLHMRHDLIPNLVKTVQQYAAHEQQVLENVTSARATAMQAANLGEKGKAEASLDGALMKLLAVSENYPALKADTNFIKLQDELAGVERTIAAARRYFNNATSEFNTACQQFPANLIARPLGFKEEMFLEVSAEQRALHEVPPSVSFQ